MLGMYKARHGELFLKSPWHRTKITAAALLIALGTQAHAASTAPAKLPLIVAHYMPWFEAKPTSPRWGWHWTMNAFDPEQLKDGVRSIASHYHPLVGPYDSSDPAVIEYHLLLMKLAGIDGIMVDWDGLSSLYDYPIVHRNTILLFRLAAKMGLHVGICYEDQTIPKLVEAKLLRADERVQHAQGELDWVRKNWFAESAYLKLNGRPVLLSFGWDGLTEPEWAQVLGAFPSSASPDGAPLYLSEHRRRSAAAGSFDWPQPQTWPASLDRYYQSVRGDRVFMPVAFPRFHDIYAEAKVHAGYGQIADEEGRTFATTLERALTSGAPLVQIATWNDWGEGTIIEPSKEFGYRDLETIQRLRRKRIDPSFPATPDDLRLPYRLWQLRHRQAAQPALKPQLDEVARLLVSGKTTKARATLTRIEAMAGR